MDRNEVSLYRLNAAFAYLQKFDCLAHSDHFIEISLWHNGEGFDVNLCGYHNQSFQLTWGQFGAIQALLEALDK